MKRLRKDVAPRARGRNDGGNKLKTAKLHLQYTTVDPQSASRDLSNLLDLATLEAQQLAEQAQHYQRLADAYRRRMYAKLNNLYELQRMIPTSGGQQ